MCKSGVSDTEETGGYHLPLAQKALSAPCAQLWAQSLSPRHRLSLLSSYLVCRHFCLGPAGQRALSTGCRAMVLKPTPDFSSVRQTASAGETPQPARQGTAQGRG